jgi:hypothetical protein
MEWWVWVCLSAGIWIVFLVSVAVVLSLRAPADNNAAWHEHQRSRRFFDRW